MTAYNKNVPRERGHGSRPIEGREILEIPLKEGTVMKKNFLNYLVKACAAYEYSMGWDVAYMRYEKGCWEQCGKHDEKTGPRFGRSIIRKLTPADKVVFRRVLFYNKLTNDSGSREDSIVMIGLKRGMAWKCWKCNQRIKATLGRYCTWYSACGKYGHLLNSRKADYWYCRCCPRHKGYIALYWSPETA